MVMAATRATRWLRPPEPVGHQVPLHGGRGDGVAPVPEPIGVLAAPDGRLHHGQGEQLGHHVGGGGVGQLGRPPGLRHQRLESVALGQGLPLVVAGAGHPEHSAGLGHISGFSGQIQQTDTSLIDDLCWGHGDGLLVSLVGNKASIAGPL
jgi:hypothetical protein